MVELTPSLQQALDSNGTGPLPVRDPRNNREYVLVSSETYEQMRLALEQGFDNRGAYPLMDKVAAKEGWDDPSMDIYNDFAEKRP